MKNILPERFSIDKIMLFKKKKFTFKFTGTITKIKLVTKS